MNFKIKHNLILCTLLFLSIGCDNDDTSASSVVIPEEHTDADGMVLKLDGEEVYREFEGSYVTTLTNNLNISVGNTVELSVHFLDGDGNEIDTDDHDHDDVHCDEFTTEAECGTSDECEWHADDNACEDADHDHSDDEDGLDITITDPSIITINVEDNGIHLIPTNTGSTTFTIQLMHEGHADYTSMPIAVDVN